MSVYLRTLRSFFFFNPSEEEAWYLDWIISVFINGLCFSYIELFPFLVVSFGRGLVPHPVGLRDHMLGDTRILIRVVAIATSRENTLAICTNFRSYIKLILILFIDFFICKAKVEQNPGVYLLLSYILSCGVYFIIIVLSVWKPHPVMPGGSQHVAWELLLPVLEGSCGAKDRTWVLHAEHVLCWAISDCLWSLFQLLALQTIIICVSNGKTRDDVMRT